MRDIYGYEITDTKLVAQIEAMDAKEDARFAGYAAAKKTNGYTKLLVEHRKASRTFGKFSPEAERAWLAMMRYTSNFKG